MDHLTPEQMRRYQKQELTSAEIAECADHLFHCDACRNEIRKTAELRAAYSSLESQFPREVHVSYEEITAYADNAAADSVRAKVDAHLSGCPECKEQLQDLLSIRDSLKPIPLRRQFSARRTLLLAASLAFMALGTWLLINRWANRPSTNEVQNQGEPGTTVLKDGARRMVLTREGNLQKLQGVSPEMLAWMETAIHTKQLPVASTSDLNPGGSTLLGPQNTQPFTLSYPVGVVVLAETPEFRWNPLEGAGSYTVTVLDQDLNEVVESPAVKATAWSPPAALERGKTYTWQVTAVKKGEEITSPVPPAPEALFKVLETEKAQEIEMAKQQNSPHLLMAILYARAGLLEEARKEAEILRAQNPDSPIASGLAGSLQNPR